MGACKATKIFNVKVYQNWQARTPCFEYLNLTKGCKTLKLAVTVPKGTYPAEKQRWEYCLSLFLFSTKMHDC